jgi:hypothetical protein
LRRQQKIEEMREIGRAAAYLLRYWRLAPIAKPRSHPVEGRDWAAKKDEKKFCGDVEMRQIGKMGAAELWVRRARIPGHEAWSARGHSKLVAQSRRAQTSVGA